MKFAFAGDRQISVNILNYLISKGFRPLALFVTGKNRASHSEELIEIADVSPEFVFHGNEFKGPLAVQNLKSLDLDYIIGIHFPYIITEEILSIPKIGFLNLHPAYLPYNKGWHTPSWAIYEGTKYGATLHFMSEQLDEGDIIYQKECMIEPADTADTLYQKVLDLEEEVFKEALPQLISLNPNRKKQVGEGTAHNKKDLQLIQRLNLNEQIVAGELMKKLKALTTNNINEAAWFEENGKKYAVQVKIQELF